MTSIRHIGLVGYGNVGSHLGRILGQSGDIRLTICQRSQQSPPPTLPNATFSRNLEDLSGTDLIIIAINDDAIVPVVDNLRNNISGNPVVCHTAGSVTSKVMEPWFKRYGVLYPLQTFSSEKELDYSTIPVFITGSDPETTNHIKEIAHLISPIIHEINDNQRMSLHIAAVFTCNYTNALYSIGHRICTDHDLEFKYLLPLIEETARKIGELSPIEAQTGPAIRGDWATVHKHENFLADYEPDIHDLYHQLAEYIIQNK